MLHVCAVYTVAARHLGPCCNGKLYRSSDTEMDLRSAIAEAIVAMDLFCNNRFAESKSIYQKRYKHFKVIVY